MKLFFTAMVQVFFTSIQVIFLTKRLFIGVAIASFLISFIWSFNVKQIAFSGMKSRVFYSLGAMTGALIGLLFSSLL